MFDNPQSPTPEAPPPQSPPYPPPAVRPAWPPSQPPRKFHQAMETLLTVVNVARNAMRAMVLFLVIILLLGMLAVVGDTGVPYGSYFSVIKIEGVIFSERGFGEGGYDHKATLQYIKNLANNPNDKGILLYMDTPGGSLYSSDELYLTLMDYKQKTGRPVYAYMSSMCASGGYYISMAADYIVIGRTAVTGSLGAVSTLYDTSELFDKLGVRTVIVNSGAHKSTGAMGTEVTHEQQAVFQAMIDEMYDIFVELIAEGRSMTPQAVRALADGRLFTAGQALGHGLVDEIASWEKALSDFEALTDTKPYYPELSSVSFMGGLLGQVKSLAPKSEAEVALSRLNKFPSGIPLAIAPEYLYD